MRGFAAIGLDNPKCLANIGGAMRAVACYGGALIVLGGPRVIRLGKLVTDTTKAYRRIPVLQVDDVMQAIPFDCVPVAVDLVEGARDLRTYTHPERAYYIFGAEDATLGKRVLDHCRDKVMIPMNGCMNLAASVNVVLYDRLMKSSKASNVRVHRRALRYVCSSSLVRARPSATRC